jgi:RNA 3'-terminal phosphate cyclase (ATP)
MGAKVELRLERHGFEPVGGGKLVCSITPAPLHAVNLNEPPDSTDIEVCAILSGMDPGIGRRLVARACERLGVDPATARVQTVAADGSGGVLRLRAPGLHSTGFCARRVRAEKVADGAATTLQAWLQKGIAVGEFTADQLLLPMVLAGGGSFRTGPPSKHTTTNAEVIAHFYNANIQFAAKGDATIVRIKTA